jgi:predicted nucleotide-binding protein
MRIAVLGSWRRVDRDAWKLIDEEQFVRATQSLGRRIVELGHALVVGSDGRDTADYLAAEAAATAFGSQLTRRVHILAPRRGRRFFEDLRRRYPQFFVEHAIPVDDWSPAKVFQVRYADAVVILAGARESRQAGLTAAVAGRRVVAVGSFGGAAFALNELLMQSRESWDENILDSETLGVLQNPWNDALVDEVMSGVRALNQPRILIIYGRADDRNSLKAYLRDVKGLPEPIVLVDEMKAGISIATKFSEMASRVDGAIALCTPDDIGGLATGGELGDAEPRARQNVWLEIGWFWGRLGLNRVMIMTRGDLEVPSDLAGIERYAYEDTPQSLVKEIDAFLASVGQSRA